MDNGIMFSLVAQLEKNLPAMWGELGSIPGLGRSPGEGHRTHSCILAWRIPMNRGAWRATVHGVAKSRTRLSNFNFTFHFNALEKEMATHPSILAWRIPMNRGAWRATVHGVTNSGTQLSD